MHCLWFERVSIFGFPPVFRPSWNWGGYLRCSHGWSSQISQYV